MKHVFCAIILAAAIVIQGCANTPGSAAEANAVLDVASALETAYAARPGADPKVVKQLAGLLSAGQAALATWQSTANPGDLQAVNAAIAALVAYEATSGLSQSGH